MEYHIVVMGVSGSGKSTIGEALSNKLALPFFDADNYHPAANIAKMKSGKPLNDEDRLPWLEALVDLLNSNKGCILACSALKDLYREKLAEANLHVEWIYLDGSFELIRSRMEKRDHFMPESLLRSQFEALEIPKNAIRISIEDSVVEIVSEIMNNLPAK